MKNKNAYALLTVLVVFGLIFCKQFFVSEQLTDSKNARPYKDNFLPKDFSPIPLDTEEPASQEAKSSTEPIKKGHWIEIVGADDKPITGFSLIVTINSESLTGSLNQLKTSRLFLSERFPDDWVFTIYVKEHVPFVCTVLDLRQRKQIKLSRSPSIEGIVMLNKMPVPNGIATLSYHSNTYEKTARRLAVAGLIPNDSYHFNQSPSTTEIKLGRFTFPNLTLFGSYKIAVTAPGAGSMTLDAHLKTSNEQKSLVFVLNPLWTVKGRFLDPVGALAPEEIRLTVYSDGEKNGESTRMDICFDTNLNSEGQFQFSGTLFGRYRLLFHHWGKGVAMTSTHFVTIDQARVYTLSDLFAPRVKIYGRVLDGQSNPVEGVSIWGGGMTEKDVYTLPHYECKTGVDGRVALRFSDWSRLSVHIDERSLPKTLRLNEDASPEVQYLAKNQSQFQFILKQKPTPVHFIVPESLPVLFCHVYSLKNNEGYMGSGGSRKDESRSSLIFPFSKVDPGDYNIYFQGPGAPWKQTPWFGGRVTIPKDQSGEPIEIHFDRHNQLETTAHEFQFTGKIGSTLSIWSPSKTQHHNLLTLKSKKNMVIYKPRGLNFTMQAPGHLMNGQLNYDFPNTGGRVELDIQKKDEKG